MAERIKHENQARIATGLRAAANIESLSEAQKEILFQQAETARNLLSLRLGSLFNTEATKAVSLIKAIQEECEKPRLSRTQQQEINDTLKQRLEEITTTHRIDRNKQNPVATMHIRHALGKELEKYGWGLSLYWAAFAVTTQSTLCAEHPYLTAALSTIGYGVTIGAHYLTSKKLLENQGWSNNLLATFLHGLGQTTKKAMRIDTLVSGIRGNIEDVVPYALGAVNGFVKGLWENGVSSLPSFGKTALEAFYGLGTAYYGVMFGNIAFEVVGIAQDLRDLDRANKRQEALDTIEALKEQSNLEIHKTLELNEAELDDCLLSMQQQQNEMLQQKPWSKDWLVQALRDPRIQKITTKNGLGEITGLGLITDNLEAAHDYDYMISAKFPYRNPPCVYDQQGEINKEKIEQNFDGTVFQLLGFWAISETENAAIEKEMFKRQLQEKANTDLPIRICFNHPKDIPVVKHFGPLGVLLNGGARIPIGEERFYTIQIPPVAMARRQEEYLQQHPIQQVTQTLVSLRESVHPWLQPFLSLPINAMQTLDYLTGDSASHTFENGWRLKTFDGPLPAEQQDEVAAFWYRNMISLDDRSPCSLASPQEELKEAVASNKYRKTIIRGKNNEIILLVVTTPIENAYWMNGTKIQNNSNDDTIAVATIVNTQAMYATESWGLQAGQRKEALKKARECMSTAADYSLFRGPFSKAGGKLIIDMAFEWKTIQYLKLQLNFGSDEPAEVIGGHLYSMTDL
ncbi:MAG: hypothetical protein WCP97_06065 [bacterium]